MAAVEKLLHVGLRTFETINSPRYDLRLLFAADNLQLLEAAMDPEEREVFAIVWRPPPPPAVAAAGNAAGTAARARGGGLLRGAACGCFGGGCAAVADTAESSGSVGRVSDHSDVTTEAAVIAKPGDAAGYAAARKAPPAGGAAAEGMRARAARLRAGGWVLFHCNVLAFLYLALYCKAVPQAARVPGRTLRALQPYLTDEQKAQGGVVRHAFARAG
jgi:hypothetical protein